MYKAEAHIFSVDRLLATLSCVIAAWGMLMIGRRLPQKNILCCGPSPLSR